MPENENNVEAIEAAPTAIAETTAEVAVKEAPEPESPPLSDVPGLNAIVTVAAVSAIAAYGMTWLARSLLKVKGGAWHWKLRLIALVGGSAAGFALGGWPWGAIVGLGGGALTTSVVAVIKKRLKKSA